MNLKLFFQTLWCIGSLWAIQINAAAEPIDSPSSQTDDPIHDVPMPSAYRPEGLAGMPRYPMPRPHFHEHSSITLPAGPMPSAYRPASPDSEPRRFIPRLSSPVSPKAPAEPILRMPMPMPVSPIRGPGSYMPRLSPQEQRQPRTLNQIEQIMKTSYPAALEALTVLKDYHTIVYEKLITSLPMQFDYLTEQYCKELANIVLHPNDYLKPTIPDFRPDGTIGDWMNYTSSPSSAEFYNGNYAPAIAKYLRFTIFGRMFNVENIRKTKVQPYFIFVPEISYIEDLERFARENTPESLRKLTNEYKIHINPSDAYLEMAILKLLKIISENRDFFQENVETFKIVPLNELDREGSSAPALVIYVTKGKEFAQRVLDFIYKEFKDFSDPGCFYEPLYNERVTPVLFFAQGSRNFKNNPEFKDLFEKDKVYFRTGLTRDQITGIPDDYTLKNPASK